MQNYTFTSESVSEGHPDKICDQVSDAILDLYLKHDPHARVAVETVVTTDRMVVLGEVSSTHQHDSKEIEKVARGVVRFIGYEQEGFHWETLMFENLIHEQSADIAQGLGNQGEGAGDQGIMFGYACRESKELMPLPISLAHKIVKVLAEGRKFGELKGLGPDAKSQVSVRYRGGKPHHIASIVLSTQHDEILSQTDVYNLVVPVIKRCIPEELLVPETHYLINPSGRFVIGGPVGDAGLTGRKIIVDTYGGAAPHGGGAFSGKDPTKVDRSATYMARYLAKNIVAAGVAERCTIQLSYAIGYSQPVSVYVNTHKTGEVSDEELAKVIRDGIDLTPIGIRTKLDLNRPIYQPAATYGHFGRESQDNFFTWERQDLVEDFRKTLMRAA